VRFGLSTHNTAQSVRIGVIARAVEERGFESLFVGEHPQVPTSLATPYPSGQAGAPPYEREMDPFVSLSAAAATTSTLMLGTAVCLALEHDVFDLAKSVATLDVLSGGRVLFGVGTGWNVEELANVRPDVPWSARYRALSECVLALQQLWTVDEAEFHGEFFDFDPVWCAPKPVQSPHPRILAGLGGRIGSAHALQWADEWLPMAVALGQEQRKVTKFRQVAADAGREGLPISVLLPPTATVELVGNLVSLEVERIIFTSPPALEHDQDALFGFLDDCLALADRVG
jgi:probable F420-dependent oxidoreductase